METTQQDQTPAQFAIVELFGHQRVAGKISQQTFGGASFVRVDVPEIEAQEREYVDGRGYVTSVRTIQAHTRSFGGGAIYAINWCDETTAQIAARAIKHEPLSPYSVKSAIDALPDDQRHRLLTSSRKPDLIREDDDDSF